MGRGGVGWGSFQWTENPRRYVNREMHHLARAIVLSNEDVHGKSCINFISGGSCTDAVPSNTLGTNWWHAAWPTQVVGPGGSKSPGCTNDVVVCDRRGLPRRRRAPSGVHWRWRVGRAADFKALTGKLYKLTFTVLLIKCLENKIKVNLKWNTRGVIPKKSHQQSAITISKWHVTNDNEGPTLKTSVLEILYCVKLALST